MENKFEFKHTTREKLEWIASRNVDPRLSQIHNFFPRFMEPYFSDGFERHQLFEYSSVAEELIYELDDGSELEENISDMVDKMYEDIIQNNKYGFIFDW